MVKIFSLLIYRVEWMEENGVTYKPDCIVFWCFQEDIPIFGIIKEILYMNKIFFVLHLLETDLLLTFMHTKLSQLHSIMHAHNMNYKITIPCGYIKVTVWS